MRRAEPIAKPAEQLLLCRFFPFHSLPLQEVPMYATIRRYAARPELS